MTAPTDLTEKLDRTLYPGFVRNWDDRLFRERILEHINPTAVVLDLGAGAGEAKGERRKAKG